MKLAIKALVQAMRGKVAADSAVQARLDMVVPQTNTGYLQRAESWTVDWVTEDEGEIELAISPPEGAHEWTAVTAELLTQLKKQLCCDEVQAFPTSNGEMQYRATWRLK